jgi:hypothetical protein
MISNALIEKSDEQAAAAVLAEMHSAKLLPEPRMTKDGLPVIKHAWPKDVLYNQA